MLSYGRLTINFRLLDIRDGCSPAVLLFFLMLVRTCYFILSASLRVATQSCVDKKISFSHWDSSSNQWLIGPNCPLLEPIRRVLSHVAASSYIFRLTFGHYPTFHTRMSVGRKKLLSMSKILTLFRALVKYSLLFFEKEFCCQEKHYFFMGYIMLKCKYYFQIDNNFYHSLVT